MTRFWSGLSQRHYIGLAISLPIALCVILYLQDRSLLLDSLNLSRNVSERSYVDLLLPLDYEQSAPLFFLWASKIATSLFGFSQYVLRLVPLVAGVAGIWLFAWVAIRQVGTGWGIVATIWMGTHQMYVRYATEYKQYMTDLFSTVVVLTLLDRYPYLDKKSVWVVSVAGAVLVWLSMPVIFVLGASVVYYGYVHWRDHRSMWLVLQLGAVIGISFLANYFLILLPTIESSHMQSFHDEYFMQADLIDGAAWSHNVNLIIGHARMLVGKSAIAIASVLILVVSAIILGLRRRDPKLLLWVLPIGAAYIASMMGLYSILDRLMMFALPLLILMATYGLRSWCSISKKPNRMAKYAVVGILLLGLVVGILARQGMVYITEPFEQEDNRSAIEHIAQYRDQGIYIVTSQHAYPAYHHYGSLDMHYRDLALGESRALTFEDDLIGEVVSQLTSKDRVWVLAQHQLDGQLNQLEKDLTEIGIIRDRYRTKAAGAFLIANK